MAIVISPESPNRNRSLPLPTRYTNYSFADLVMKAEGDDYNKPDIVYEFSNGKKTESTDKTDSGIYER